MVCHSVLLYAIGEYVSGTRITLDKALPLAETGEITIVSTLDDTSYHPLANEWYSNYISLKEKARHIQSDRLFTHFPAHYTIEIPNDIDEDTIEWIYLFGIKNPDIKSRTKDNIEYIYILTNPGEPGIIKIGMTERTVEGRVNGINGYINCITEWVPKFALPVSKGNAFKIEQQMHKIYAAQRVDSDQGHEREFFKLDHHSLLLISCGRLVLYTKLVIR
jgi:hypothetical protein